jgi:hypothetical protein
MAKIHYWDCPFHQHARISNFVNAEFDNFGHAGEDFYLCSNPKSKYKFCHLNNKIEKRTAELSCC